MIPNDPQAVAAALTKVNCLTHGLNCGYVCCRHVIDMRFPVATITHPSLRTGKWSLGQIDCARDGHKAEDYVLVCRDCAIAYGISKVGGIRKQGFHG